MPFSKQLIQTVITFGVKLLMVFITVLATILIGSKFFFDAAKSTVPGNVQQMTADGVAKRKVTPDSAQITLAKNLRGQNIAELQTKTANSVNALIEKLKAAGVKEEQIKTSNYALNPVYNNEGDIRTYAINVAVDVTLEKTNPQDELLNKVITAGSESGIDEVRNLNFYLADQEKMAQELEQEAIADAKAVAEKRAQAAGARLGKVVSVNVGGRPIFSSRDMLYDTSGVAEGKASAIAPDFQAGEFDLETRVTVTYELY